MIAFLCLVSISVLLFAGFRWASSGSTGSSNRPPRNRATEYFATFGTMFRKCTIITLMVAWFLFGLNFMIAHYGALGAATMLLALFCLPSLFFTPKLGAATTVARDTQVRDAVIANYPVAAATLLPAGVMAALDASGNAVNASDTAALRVVGRTEQTVDNSGGGAGDLTINVRRGCFKWANSGTQAVTAAYKDKLVYVEDNQTVAITSTNKIVAGRVIEVASDGVWVDSTDRGAAGAAVVTTVGAALVDITGGESPTEGEFNTAGARINQLRVDVLAIAAKINGG